MRILPRPRYAVALACSVSLVVSALAWSAIAGPGEAPAGERPAKASARIAAALFLAVTRAGPRLVAVGERGFVLLSDDGGRQWRQAREVPVSVTLTNVQFVSAEVGWAVGHGGVVLHSRDGGERWTRQLDGVQAAALVLADAQAALAAAGGDEARQQAAQRLVREAGGLVADGPDKPLLGLHFEDERHGRVVGAYGLALATDDGGASWYSLVTRIDNRGGKHLYDIRRAGDEFVIAGEQGTLLRADARGGHFAAVATPYAGTWFGTLAGAGGDLVAYGLRGNVYRRGEGWTSWEKVDAGAPVTLTAGLALADGSLVLADATGRVLRSRDGGRHFSALAAGAARSFTGMAQAGDGALVLSGPGGMTRIEPVALAAADQPAVQPQPAVETQP